VASGSDPGGRPLPVHRQLGVDPRLHASDHVRGEGEADPTQLRRSELELKPCRQISITRASSGTGALDRPLCDAVRTG
jgi:hypothetical protein